MVIFKSKQKKFEGDLKIRLCSKRLYPTENVKYVGINWQCQINDLSIKLNGPNAPLVKTRKYVSAKLLRSIYFIFFKSHLSYCSLV